MSEKTPLKVVVVGHVDDGKSTLIGRLLYETDSLPDGKLEEIQAVSLKRNMPLEWSFVLDAFQAERDQAITIDTSQIVLKTESRSITIIDAPGHVEFLKNMVSGAASADAALLLVDAQEGVRQQTQRHAYLLSFLGIKQIAVVINKMDLVGFSEARYAAVCNEITTYFNKAGIQATNIIPISARHGDGLKTPSTNMVWYRGPTVLEALNQFSIYETLASDCLRFPVQDVYKFDERRIIVGRIDSGELRVGDEILLSPANQTAKVSSIESWHAALKCQANAGESVGITIDKPLFIERGDVISGLESPPILTNQFRATLFWLGDAPLQTGNVYKMKLSTRETMVIVESIECEINIELSEKQKSTELLKNQCGEVILRARDVLPLDEYQNLRGTGRFVLVENYEIVAGGMISMRGFVNQRTEFAKGPLHLTKVTHGVSKQTREVRLGHRSGILWMTGLSGAGKSTLAMAVEHLLFSKGYQVYVLDGDNIRSGLNANLGFSPEDRSENIRRIGEVAALFADAGFICIAAFISPYAKDRNNVRKMVDQSVFHEVYIKADIEDCERRDPKGLYKKARAGSIGQFTGVSAPYEVPVNPELVIDTGKNDIETCVLQISEYVQAHFSLSSKQKQSAESYKKELVTW